MVAIKATHSAANGYPTLGLCHGAGARCAGRIELAGSGLPEGIGVTDQPRVITSEHVRTLLPRREATADKRDAGAVIIVGGALSYPGAPRLAALGALRSGAGYATLAVPRSIFGIVAGTVLEATYQPLPESDGDLGAMAAEALAKELERFQAMVIGPGLGRERGVDLFLQRLFGVANQRRGVLGFGAAPPPPPTANLLPETLKIVVDADALNLLADWEGWPERLPVGSILTPNLREMARLTGQEAEAIMANPGPVVRAAAERWGHIVVLKKGQSLVGTPAGDLFRVAQASPELATAGTGDVLSGSIGGLLAQGLTPVDAAVTALHAGMLAGERGAARFGTLGLIAGDMPALLAETLRELAAGER